MEVKTILNFWSSYFYLSPAGIVQERHHACRVYASTRIETRVCFFYVGKHITSQAFAFLFTVTLVIVTLALLLNEVTMTAVPLHADGAK